MNDILEIEPRIRFSVCPRCLKKLRRNKHIDNCHPRFTKPIFQKLSRLIVQITPGSPELEKLIYEHMSKASVNCKGIRKPILRKWSGLQAFLLTVDEEIASYIVIGRDDIVYDMFTVPSQRGKGNMRFLLRHVLESMNRRFDTVWFREPLHEAEWHFLESVSEETGLSFKTC